MNAKDFIIDNCCNWEAIKALNKLFPELKIVSSFALIIEPIYSVD